VGLHAFSQQQVVVCGVFGATNDACVSLLLLVLLLLLFTSNTV
jgi:hypothetical protein